MAQIEPNIPSVIIDSSDYQKFIKQLPKGYMEEISKKINYTIKHRMIRKVLKGDANDNHDIIVYAISLATKEQAKKESLKKQIKEVSENSK